MIKFITVWMLTVTYVNIDHGSRAGGGATSYQLQYADQKTCLAELKNHVERRVPQKGFAAPDKVYNENKAARCDKAQVPVVMK